MRQATPEWVGAGGDWDGSLAHVQDLLVGRQVVEEEGRDGMAAASLVSLLLGLCEFHLDRDVLAVLVFVHHDGARADLEVLALGRGVAALVGVASVSTNVSTLPSLVSSWKSAAPTARTVPMALW